MRGQKKRVKVRNENIEQKNGAKIMRTKGDVSKGRYFIIKNCPSDKFIGLKIS